MTNFCIVERRKGHISVIFGVILGWGVLFELCQCQPTECFWGIFLVELLSTDNVLQEKYTCYMVLFIYVSTYLNLCWEEGFKPSQKRKLLSESLILMNWLRMVHKIDL